MADLKNVIEHLQIIRTWAELDGKMGRGMEPKCCLRVAEWVDEALVVLKVQQPRVMTLEDIRVIYHRREDHVWPFDTPPYLWVDTNSNTAHYWMSWSNVVDCLEERFPKYDPDYYGKTWRCWTTKPDEKVRAETPWE